MVVWYILYHAGFLASTVTRMVEPYQGWTLHSTRGPKGRINIRMLQSPLLMWYVGPLSVEEVCYRPY